MRFRDGFIAVDWGTSNRRAWVIDPNGKVVGHIADDHGISSPACTDFVESVYSLRARLGDLPMLLAGMVGSDRGWREVPYLRCPVSLDQLAGSLLEIEGCNAWIVPGVSYADSRRCDVMRGEEVQLLGVATMGLLPDGGLGCHPGTHAKWAHVEDGVIRDFRTVMTGELFALLKQHSILAPQLSAAVSLGDAFMAGVDRSLDGCDLTADLFSIRARSLLQGLSIEDASACASGLLIGADVRIGLSYLAKDAPLALVGEPRLTGLYAAAVRRGGRNCQECDGNEAFIDGITAIAGRMP